MSETKIPDLKERILLALDDVIEGITLGDLDARFADQTIKTMIARLERIELDLLHAKQVLDKFAPKIELPIKEPPIEIKRKRGRPKNARV